MEDESFIDDEIIELVGEMAFQDAGKAMSLLCGLLVGVAELLAEHNGENPNAKMELVGAPRVIVIEPKKP